MGPSMMAEGPAMQPQQQSMMETGEGAGSRFGAAPFMGGFGFPAMMYNPMMYNPMMMLGGMMYPGMMQYGMLGTFGPWGMGPFGVGYGYGAYGGNGVGGYGAHPHGKKPINAKKLEELMSVPGYPPQARGSSPLMRQQPWQQQAFPAQQWLPTMDMMQQKHTKEQHESELKH